MSRAKWWIACLMVTLGGWAHAADAPSAEPESLSFSRVGLERIDQFFSDKVSSGGLAGVVTLIARHGKIAHFSAVGYADTARKQKLQRDSIFRLYSMTKPIAATALMTLYEEGKFQLDDPISKYIPEFKGIRVLRTPESPPTDTVPAVREPTIHDLFRHTAGLKHAGDAYEKANLFGLDTSLEEMIGHLAKIPLYYQPGTRFEYSIGQDVQARLVEILSGMPFEQFLKRKLFDPLGMRDTGYRVKDASRLSAVHWMKDGKLVPCDNEHGCPPAAVAKDINSYTTERAHKGGSSGLAGTAEDYWRFAQMMLNGGEFVGHRILGPNTVRYMAIDHLPFAMPKTTGGNSGIGWGLGFAVVKDTALAGVIGSEGTYFWAGAANTLFWVDPSKDIVVVVMTQSWNVPNADWITIRAQMSALVYGALMD